MEKDILIAHAQRYPLMQPQDAVKLIYQNEFGIGHLISDPDSFRERLIREVASAKSEPDIPLTESIGNGLVRVHLNAPKFDRLRTDALAEACLRTACEHHGSPERFAAKLITLEMLCGEGIFSFTPDLLRNYLAAYRAEGCPPVSHTGIYHEAYHPAYRVVRTDLI